MKKRTIKVIECIEYLSVEAPLERVNMLENKQSKYIREYAKANYVKVVGRVRRNGFGQLDVERQWLQIAELIRKEKVAGVIVSNMATISRSIPDAYRKVGIIREAGGVVVTVDEGRLGMNIKEKIDERKKKI